MRVLQSGLGEKYNDFNDVKEEKEESEGEEEESEEERSTREDTEGSPSGDNLQRGTPDSRIRQSSIRHHQKTNLSPSARQEPTYSPHSSARLTLQGSLQSNALDTLRTGLYICVRYQLRRGR